RLLRGGSGIRRLSAEVRARSVVFDVRLWDGEPVWRRPLEERRAELERVATGFGLSPCTRNLADARGWLDRFEALGLDGVIGKRLDSPYRPGLRDAVVKIKEHRTADCVVVGVRWKAGRTAIATMLLGRYDDDGEVDDVGACAAGARMQKDVADRVLPRLDESAQQYFSEPNRWGTGDLEQTAVRRELVVEVRYDKVQGNRFRHGTKFIRWRDDKDP